MKRMFDPESDDIEDGVQNVRDVLELVALAFRWRESDGWLDLSPKARNGLLLLLESLGEVLDDVTNTIQERDAAKQTPKPRRTLTAAKG